MRYVYKPIEVEAGKITQVSPRREDGSYVLVVDDGTTLETKTATAAMCARMLPEVGDYFVAQADGYEYVNPKAVFEAKFIPVPAGVA